MQAPNLLPNAFAELFAQATITHTLTLADRYGMMAAICDESTSVEEREALDRLFYAVRQGLVYVVDELSAVL